MPGPSMGSRAVRRMLTAFGYRDFRILWLGSFASSIGTWMQNVAENWLVLSLTGSAFYLGLDAFLQQVPILLFTLLGGVLADRLDRRRTLLASQYVQMTCAFTLALLVYSSVVHVWEILALSFFTGFAQAFGGPASQALVPSLVEKNDLPNAVALNSIQFNLARVVGPLLAGAALAKFGMPSCFSLNGLSFLIVIAALMSLHVRHQPPAAPRRWQVELREGLSYVRGQRTVIALTLIAATTTFLAFAVITLLPIFAQRVFHQGVVGYSHLMAYSGIGAVVGALVVAWMGRHGRMGISALLVQGTCGVLIVAFALSRMLWLSDILLFLIGAALIVALATTSSLVQLIVPDELRGRVMSIYMMAFRGGMPIGSLICGFFASRVGPSNVLVCNGILLVLLAGLFLVRERGLRTL
jgi:MFS family permease